MLEVETVLKRFRDYVIQQSRSNLSKGNKNSSKALYNSIDGEVVTEKKFTIVGFTMLDYGHYQDKGVSGKLKKYNTPYSYKDKMPPAKAFDKWIVKKGIAPRNAKGEFQSRQSLQYAIARSIFLNGIKPSLFFTKPFEAGYKKYITEDLIKGFALDVEDLMKTSLKDNKK
jgi:hypothetical protein